MDDLVPRLLMVAAVLAFATGMAFVSRRTFSVHPTIDLDGNEFEPGLVVFTSTGCTRCKVVLAAAKSTGANLREVTYEIEAGLQEQLGVSGVPLTIVIDPAGKPAAQFAGLVRAKTLQRELSRAGV